MAFRKKISIGKAEIEGVATIKKIKFGGKLSPATAELHVMPDLETYNQWKDEERGYKLDENGSPIRNHEGKTVGVTKTLDYDKILLRIEQLNSRDLGPEKDAEFREKILALFYEYFGVGKEKV